VSSALAHFTLFVIFFLTLVFETVLELADALPAGH
jgi:hypothetical protein